MIGDNALIAPNVQIYTAFHPANAIDRFGEPKADGSFRFCKTQTAPVIIGNNVWIGGSAYLLKNQFLQKKDWKSSLHVFLTYATNTVGY